MKVLSVFLLLCFATVCRSQQQVSLSVRVMDDHGQPLPGAEVRMTESAFKAITERNGTCRILLPARERYSLVITLSGYAGRIIEVRTKDSIAQEVRLSKLSRSLDTVQVVARHVPETIASRPAVSVRDFDFYDENYLLLMSESSLRKASVVYANAAGKTIDEVKVPSDAGEAQYFHRDYEGYTDLVCKDTVFRIDIWNNRIVLMGIPRTAFERYVKPILDSADQKFYFTDQWAQYPAFNYKSIKKMDTLAQLICTIRNEDLISLYNLELYYLPPKMQLEARRIADSYKIDEHIAAALLSGFTQSRYYDPLYAPLFVIDDTLCIFNHYKDRLYHYTMDGTAIDSVAIKYHHPKNWREWKRKMYLDELDKKVYALYAKDEHYYLKRMHHHTGKEELTYKLQNHSGGRVKVRGGYAYYVYRPFGSTQASYLYREKIE